MRKESPPSASIYAYAPILYRRPLTRDSPSETRPKASAGLVKRRAWADSLARCLAEIFGSEADARRAVLHAPSLLTFSEEELRDRHHALEGLFRRGGVDADVVAMLRREPLLLTYDVSTLRAKVDALEADLPQVHVRTLLSENPRLLASDNIWPLHSAPSAARDRAVRRLPRRASSAGTLRQRAGVPSSWVRSSNTLDMGIPEYDAKNDKHASIYPRPHPRSSPSASRCASLASSSRTYSSSTYSSMRGSPGTMPGSGTAPIGSGTGASRCSTAAAAGTGPATCMPRSTTLVSSGASRSTLMSADGTASVVDSPAAGRPRCHMLVCMHACMHVDSPAAAGRPRCHMLVCMHACMHVDSPAAAGRPRCHMLVCMHVGAPAAAGRPRRHEPQIRWRPDPMTLALALTLTLTLTLTLAFSYEP